MRLALETRTPIVPVAVVGAEEQFPALANLKGLARLLGTPSFPVIPQLLVGLPLPLPPPPPWQPRLPLQRLPPTTMSPSPISTVPASAARC